MTDAAHGAGGSRDAWSYVLVTPDGVASGAVGVVLDLLVEHGLRPGYCRPVGLEVKIMQELYGGSTTFRIQQPGLEDFEFSWKTHEALYGIAPACLIMASHPGGDACRAMLRCKGKTRPELADLGTVRRLGENVVFNLVHCPDDAVSARRELELLLGATAADSLPTLTAPLTPDVERMAGAMALPASLPAAGDWESISFPLIVNRIRRRVVQHAAPALVSHPAELSALARAHDLLDIERGWFCAEATSRERLLIAIFANEAISAELADAVSVLHDDVLVQGLEALSALLDLRAPRSPEAVFAVADRGIYLAPLERVIVESHAFAFRPNREIDELY